MQLRDDPLCAACLASNGRVRVATIADHIEPHRGDWSAFWTNKLQSLCDECHRAKHGKQRIEIGADGWPIEQPEPHVDLGSHFDCFD